VADVHIRGQMEEQLSTPGSHPLTRPVGGDVALQKGQAWVIRTVGEVFQVTARQVVYG
jgi:hypothetical protein